jgi:hypothetical protein
MSRVIDTIYEFNQNQKRFGYLMSIEFAREFNEMDCTDYSVNIFLCDFPHSFGNPKMLLVFTGVRNLKFGDLDGLVKTFINITDISNHQIEGVKYSVKEAENETFSFCCKSFSCKVLY